VKMMIKKILPLVSVFWFTVIAIGFCDSFESLRHVMVDNQIIRRGVSDPNVIKAMRDVPRHLLVPKDYRPYAYEDRPLPIGYNQTISQPYIVAFMTEAVQLTGSERVLEIGTGSGYQAAILAEIVKEVYSIEIIKKLAERARKDLKNLGYDNIVIRHGDGYKGIEEFAPYDAIIVTAAPDKIPQELVKQLKVGGRMVVPVGSFFQDLYLITKNKASISKKNLLPVRFVPMIKGDAKK